MVIFKNISICLEQRVLDTHILGDNKKKKLGPA